MNKMRASILLYAIVFALFTTFAIQPESWETHRPYVPGEDSSLSTITIVAPIIATTLFLASAVTAVLLLILAPLGFVWKVVRYPRVALFLAIIAFPAATIGHIVRNLDPWTVHGRVTDTDGQTYIFCDSSFLQGQTMALAHLTDQNRVWMRLDVLGTNNGDFPRSWASVVRPSTPENEYGQLYLTKSKWLVGIRFENHCFLAYDLNHQRLIGNGQIELISPFICIEKSGDLHEPDIQAINQVLAIGTPGTAGFPHRESVEAELKNPNANVQRAAKKMLEKLKPSVGNEVSEPVSPDPN